jgi:hypothetical protein
MTSGKSERKHTSELSSLNKGIYIYRHAADDDNVLYRNLISLSATRKFIVANVISIKCNTEIYCTEI